MRVVSDCETGFQEEKRARAVNSLRQVFCVYPQCHLSLFYNYFYPWTSLMSLDLRYQSVMRQVSVDVTHWESCKRSIGMVDKNLPYKLTPVMFCAGGAHNHDSCQVYTVFS